MDNWAVPAGDPAVVVGGLRHDEGPVPAVPSTLRNCLAGDRYAEPVPVAPSVRGDPREEDELDGPRQGGLTGAVGGSAPGG